MKIAKKSSGGQVMEKVNNVDLQHLVSLYESDNRKLRYERLMAKAAYFNQDHDIIGAIWRCGNSQKLWRDYCIQWYRIANAIDIRLAKLKETK